MTNTETVARIFFPAFQIPSDVAKVQDSNGYVWNKTSQNGQFWTSENGTRCTLAQVRNRSRFLVEVL